jgi:hypothetical protein
MKKTALIAIAAMISISAMSQDTTRVEQYCQLLAWGKMFSTKVSVTVDFGQSRKLISTSTNLILDDQDKPRKFNSVMDALNYMGLRGWTLVNAFPMTIGDRNVYHYVMKKYATRAELEQFRQELEEIIKKAEVEK